jgi:putative Holliday junction resolvase
LHATWNEAENPGGVRGRECPASGSAACVSFVVRTRVRAEGMEAGMKYLAIDYGEKRTGIAVSDPAGIMAFPRQTLAMRGREAFFAELLALAAAEGAEAFVVGLPSRRDGTDGETARRVRNMAEGLRRRVSLPVYLVEETLSSWEGEQRLRAAGRRGRAVRARRDQAAAVAILETFLRKKDASCWENNGPHSDAREKLP